MKKLPLLLLLCYIALTLQNFASPADTAATATSFNVDSATSHWLNTLSPEARHKSDSYFEGGYWLQIWNFLYAFVIAFIFLQLGLSKLLKRLAQKVKSVNLQNLIYVILYLLLTWALTFPLSVYADYFREH